MEILDNIIEKMIQQHRSLQKDIGVALVLSKSDENRAEEINAYLKQFSADLKEHLALENGVFYPKLILSMKNGGVDTSKTEVFINEMKDIGVTVTKFLENYNEVSTIENNINNFKNELELIVSVLNLRIESEEQGVYGYWSIYK